MYQFSNREFCRSVPVSIAARARFERIRDVVLAAVLGAALGVLMGLGV